MRKIDAKKFSGMVACNYESALQVLGSCALEKVSLIKYRQQVEETPSMPALLSHMRYTSVHVQYGYIWKSLVSDCWLRAEMHSNIVPECGELVCFPRKRGKFTEQEFQTLMSMPPIQEENGPNKIYYGPIED